MVAAEQLFPLYGRFRERFQSQANSWDISLSEDVDRCCYRSDEFRRVAIPYLIVPEQHASDFRAYLCECFSTDQADQLFRIAERVAAGLEKDPRLVSVQTRRELRNQIDASTEQVTRQLEDIAKSLADLAQTGTVRHAETTAGIAELIAEVRQIPANHDHVAGVQRDSLSGHEDETAESAIEKLRKVDLSAADKVQALWDTGGIARLTRIARSEPPPPLPSAAWRTIGNILAEAELSPDAEAAFVHGTFAATSDGERSELYVGAARAADADGRHARADEHLARARESEPAHPALAVCEARRHPDRAKRLERLRDVESDKPTVQAQIHQTRGEAYLVLRDFDRAREELKQAQRFAPAEPIVRELSGMIPWFEAVLARQEGRLADKSQLREAATTFTVLGTRARERGRIDEATQILSRAVQCLAMAHDTAGANELAEDLVKGTLLSPVATAAAGNAAIFAGRPELVLDLISDDTSDERCQLVLASAKMLTSDTDMRSAARLTLIGLLQSEASDVAQNAAITLLRESGETHDARWNAQAEDVLRPDQPFLAVLLHAMHHLASDEVDEAECLLLPHSSRADALKLLVDCAVAQKDWEKVADRSRALVALTNDPDDRLNWARALSRSGETDAARAQFLTVARKPSTSSHLKDRAFGLAVAEVDPLDFVGREDLAAEWIEAVPPSPAARWNLAYAYTRLGRVPEAYELVGECGPEDLTLDQARLLAEIVQRFLPVADAFPRLLALSEQFGRAEEALEAAVVQTAVFAGAQPLPDDLIEQAKEAVARFSETFPASTTFRTLPAPESGEAFLETLKELEGDRPKRIREADELVDQERAPAAFIAAFAGRGCLETWARLPGLPLGNLDPDTDALDDEAARAAIGGAVIWDTSSLYVLSLLPQQVRDAIVNALPGSMVSTDVLADAIAADENPDQAAAVVGTNEDGSGWLYEPTPAELSQRRDRIALARAQAQALTPRVANGSPQDSRWASLYLDHRYERRTALDSALATIVVAESERRTVYSDDRWVRKAARDEGLAAFGTLGLLAALQELELIEPSAHEQARRCLAAERSWGVGLTAFELLRAARDTGFDATGPVGGALQDRAAWRRLSDTVWPAFIELLIAASHEAPQMIDALLRTAVHGYQAAHFYQRSPTEALEMTLAIAWANSRDTVAVPQRCFRAIAETARAYAAELDPPAPDPVVEAARRIIDGCELADDDERRELVELLALRVDPTAAELFERQLSAQNKPTPSEAAS